MRDDLTDITLVVDRSGSMDAIRDDAEGGINAFIAQQAQQAGDARLTLVEFDEHSVVVCSGVPIADAPQYTLQPRGTTALLDAVGRAIQKTGARLAALPEADRPGLVVFVIMTDGHENASRAFTREQVRAMIAHQQEVYQWQFTFLGADASAFAAAGGMGIDAQGVARFDKRKVLQAYRGTSAKVSRMRLQLRSGRPVDNVYTDEERDDMG